MQRIFKLTRKLMRRLLAVSDPVEMKTEPGTEILVGTDLTDADFRPDEEDDEPRAHAREGTPTGAFRRVGHVHVRGYGQVT